MSDTPTANNGFPLTSATLSDAFQSSVDCLDGETNRTHPPSTSYPHPREEKFDPSQHQGTYGIIQKESRKRVTIPITGGPVGRSAKFHFGLSRKRLYHVKV